MMQYFVRLAGQEVNVTKQASNLSWITGRQPLRRIVVQTYIEMTDKGALNECFETVQKDGDNETVLDMGTIQEAYTSLDSSDRIDLFMSYANHAFEYLHELPYEVRYILFSRSQ